ncbi:MAG: hypothetical protein V7K48_27035 [Nostoc sp.]|uniref:hypothetical protein n=1 Tax=Nostoc sp. TaxID=1180 RepID=UPI002FF86E32
MLNQQVMIAVKKRDYRISPSTNDVVGELIEGYTKNRGSRGSRGENLSKCFLQIPKFNSEGADLELIGQQHHKLMGLV